MKLALCLSAGALLVAAPALADTNISIVLTPEGQQLASDLGKSSAELEGDLERELGEALQLARVDDFIRAFGDATSFSNRGVGVDYASNSKSLIFGVAGNLAVAAEDLDFDADQGEYPVAGIAPNLTVMAGLNFSKWNLPKLTVFGNGFYRKADLGQLDGSITNVGLHAQVRLIDETTGKSASVVKWGGIDVTGGVEWTRWTFGLERPLESSFPLTGSGGSTEVSTAATGRFDLSSQALVFPLEATTSLRFFHLLSVFGGAGIDVQSGTTKADASLNGDLTATDTGGGGDIDVGTASVTANGEGGPSKGRLRFLAGVQFNLSKLRIFLQANAIPLDTASVAFGLRVAL
ncbi:MAG: hypothetical protein R2939_07475 [Kofleriaceae bacterium]